jgi:hypothetical protein
LLLSIVYALPVHDRVLQVYGSGYGSGSTAKGDREEKELVVQTTAQPTGAPSAKKYTDEELEEFFAWKKMQESKEIQESRKLPEDRNKIEETRKRRLQTYVDVPLVSVSSPRKMLKS